MHRDFWDGTQWVDDPARQQPEAEPQKPSARRWSKTAVALVTMAALLIPFSAVATASARNTATIAFASSGALSATTPARGSSVSFAVTANVKASDVSNLWVANWCYQNGTAVYAQFLPVQNGIAGAFTLAWPSGAASCKAYVFLYPYTSTPLSGGTMTYSAAG